jgi:CheY-like chemotaxis protein
VGTLDLQTFVGLAQNGGMSSKTILVVEDDEVARAATSFILEQAGYTVVTAADGSEALACLKDGPIPCLILLDMLMPEFGGWKLMEKIREARGWNTIPVVVVTGVVSASMDWTKALGAAGLLKKPIEPDALLDAVRQHC